MRAEKRSADSYSTDWGARYTFFSNIRADVRICAIRLYNRRLTEEEIRHNAAIDAVRFKGAAAPLVATGPFEPQAGAIIVIR